MLAALAAAAKIFMLIGLSVNILFITSTLPRYIDDGQAPFVLEQTLSWQDNFIADQVFVLAPHDSRSKTDEMMQGVRVKRFRYWWPAAHQKLAYPAMLPNIQRSILLLLQLPAFLFCEFLAARKLVKEREIDFVFAHWVMPQGIVAYLIHRLYGIPYGLKNYSSDLRVFRRIPLLGPMLARCLIRSSVRLICENSMLRREALEYFPLSERSQYEGKVAALTMGVFHGLREEGTTDFSPYRCDFAFIGRLSKKKGVDAFIRALTVLHEEGIDFSARIAGSGEEEDVLTDLCEIPEVEFVGHLSGERKAELFRQTRFFVFPSSPAKTDVEGLPVALLEALYSGKIIIASQATNIELLPEWNELRSRVHLLEDPQNISEFAGLLRTLLEYPAEEINKIVEPTQSVTAGFGWNTRIQQYRQLLVSDLGLGP